MVLAGKTLALVSLAMIATGLGANLAVPPALASTAPSVPIEGRAADGVAAERRALPDDNDAQPAADAVLSRAIGALLAEGSSLSEQDEALTYVTTARREAVEKVYAARGFAPLWIVDATPSAVARRLLSRLRNGDRDGLSPGDYALPAALASTAGRLDPVQAARLDVLLSLALVQYADHAQAGRVEPESLSRMITASPVHPDPATALETIAEASDPVAALDGFNPPQPGFQALRDKLAELTKPGAVVNRPPVVPGGSTLKQGMRDPRVAVLRERLGVGPDEVTATVETGMADEAGGVTSGPNAEVFDARVKDAVAAFQTENGLHPDGIVGPRTLLALNAVADDGMAVSDVIANMERWRWLPRDLGAFHVIVNIPEFKARLFRDGQQVYETRVVVGKPSNQTPVFSDEMDHLIVNPYWNVPYSIASQELLPAIRANSSYLPSRNYEVLAGGRVVDPSSVDWSGVNLRSVRIRQRPGRGNALGDIKFMFPNRHSVYLHDTPSKSLFGRSNRALSHGCVRVQEPFAFADALLQLDPNWNAKRLKAMIGGLEKRVDLTRRVPVHLAYFTAFVDEGGTLQRRPDIYGHNASLTKALKVEGWQEWQRFAVAESARVAPPAVMKAEKVQKRNKARRVDADEAMLMIMRSRYDYYR